MRMMPMFVRFPRLLTDSYPIRRRGIAASLSCMTETGEEWLKTTCMSALSSLVRLQNRFFGRLAFLLSDLLKLLENCILQGLSMCCCPLLLVRVFRLTSQDNA